MTSYLQTAIEVSLASSPSANSPAPATAAQVAPGPPVVFASAADIEAFFRRRTNRSFLDWFHETQARTGAWADKDVRRDADTRQRFTQVWNRLPEIFGRPTITLEQFIALQSIFINELGGAMAPVTERMGRPGHPGMAYLFNAIPGLKRSYNQAPNMTALACFNDSAFIAAHGHLPLGNQLARSSDQAWAGQRYPNHPTDMATAGFVAQADFCKFRGRGMIQTTWRSAYRSLVRFVQGYTGRNAKVNEYRARWTGQDVETVLTRSSNADWDDLFQNSDYVIPCNAIRLHNNSSQNYLSISPDPAVRNGTGPGSFYRMGLRISGGQSYAQLFRRRCTQVFDALMPRAGANALVGPSEGPPPSSRLQWSAGTAEQLDFMRRVYDTHVRTSARRRRFVASVPSDELRPVEGGIVLRRAGAEAARRMLTDARSALAAARAAGDSRANTVDNISAVSGYRTVEQQFSGWQSNFPRYYEQTRARREGASGGAHGGAAVELTASYIGGNLAAPGYSLHNNGWAIDLGSREAGRNLGPHGAQRAFWRSSWLFSWLSANGERYGFFQNNSIDEPWHWEYRASTTPSVRSQAEVAVSLAIPASEAAVENVPLLAGHHDVGPDLILRWNAMADTSAGVDIVIHLHGYSGDRHLDLRRRKLPVSGLDFTPPPGVRTHPHPAWAGRVRPTLLVLPRGQARPVHASAYDFPALIASGGFAQLIQVALAEFATRVRAGQPVAPRRIILTAHSGGGSALNRILALTGDTSFDPHEVHVFDALYGAPTGLRSWLGRRLRRDVDRLRAGVPDSRRYLTTDGGALRILYTAGTTNASTLPASRQMQTYAGELIPAGATFTNLLGYYYHVELARVSHSLIPYWYGGRLLADAAARIPGP